MKVTPVSKIVGAEVTGVNLSDPITEDTKQGLRQALLDHQVLVIRDQTLTIDLSHIHRTWSLGINTQ